MFQKILNFIFVFMLFFDFSLEFREVCCMYFLLVIDVVNTLLVNYMNIFVNLMYYLFIYLFCFFVDFITTWFVIINETLLNTQVKQFIFCRNSNPLLFNLKLQQFFYN